MIILLLVLCLLGWPALAAAQTTWGVTTPAVTTELRLLETPANGTNYVGLKAPTALSGDLIWTMPTGDGSVGTCLSTNGAGVLAWASCSSGGTGLTSLNGQTGSTQSFADVDDTNVTLTIGSAADVHTFTMGWAGTLANTRGGTGQNSSAWSALPLVTAGTWSQYAGTGACGAGTAITALSASGVATCSALGAGNVSTGVTLTAGQLIIGAGTTNIAVGDLSGDVTTSGGTATALSLTGVGAGTYGQVTVDTKGRVSSASIIADVPHGGTGVATLTGLVFGNGAAAFSAYAGTGACPAGQSISALSGSGVATCTPAGAGDVIASGTLTANRLILGAGTTTVVAAASLGTTTTVLHGNAGGAPSFASVVDADLSGQVQVPHGGTGLASGSQGGVPYFATSTTMASSATLVNHAVVVGGGPGAPRTIGTGTAGQVLISQGASVDPIWSAATGCIVAGSNGQLQFNNSGNCGADALLSWNNTTKRLTVSEASPSGSWSQGGLDTLASPVLIDVSNYTSNREVGLMVNVKQNTGAATPRVKSGIEVDAYQPFDTGGEASGIYVKQTGGGNAVSIFRAPQDHPIGQHDYTGEIDVGHTLEVQSFDYGLAIFSATGADAGFSGLDNGQVQYMVLNKPHSRGLIIGPSDGVTFDGRSAIDIGNFDRGATTNAGVHFQLALSGSMALGTTVDPTIRLFVYDTGASGSNIKLWGNGVTTPAKFLRVFGGEFQIMSNAYQPILTLADNGSLSVSENAGTNQQLTVNGTGANGSNIKMIGDGGTTPNKYLRTATGQFQIINSAYTTPLLSLTDAGQLTIPGVYVSGSSVGLSVTKTVRDAAGTGTCTLIFTGGILTGGTC